MRSLAAQLAAPDSQGQQTDPLLSAAATADSGRHAASAAGGSSSVSRCDGSTAGDESGSGGGSSSGGGNSGGGGASSAESCKGESNLCETSGSTSGVVGSSNADVASLDGFGHADIIFVDADSDDTRYGRLALTVLLVTGFTLELAVSFELSPLQIML